MGTVPLAQDVGVSGLSCGKLESSPRGTLRGTTRHVPPHCCPGRAGKGCHLATCCISSRHFWVAFERDWAKP